MLTAALFLIPENLYVKQSPSGVYLGLTKPAQILEMLVWEAVGKLFFNKIVFSILRFSSSLCVV